MALLPSKKPKYTTFDTNRKSVHNLPIFSNSLIMLSILEFAVQDRNAKKIYIFNCINDVIKHLDFDEFRKCSSKTAYVVMQSIHTVVQKRISYDTTKSTFIGNEILITLPSDDKALHAEFKQVVSPILQSTNMDVADIMDENEILNLLHKTIPFIKVIDYGNQLIDLYEDVYTSGPHNYTENINKFISTVNRAHDKLQTFTTKGVRSYSMRDENTFKQLVKETYMDSVSPKMVLRSGCQALNHMVSPQGGFIPGFYLFYSRTKSFKSALLEWIALTMAMYNEDKFEEEFAEGITPTVCFISLENYEYQDISRLHVMLTGKQIYEAQNADAAFKNIKLGKIDIKWIYCDRQEITVDWVEQEHRKMVEIEGRKPIAFVIDYLRRMGEDSTRREDPELRLKLGRISDSLAILAQKTLRVPIISAHHLNREADRVISDEMLKGNHNVIKSLNQSMISESKLINNYVNFSAFILLEYYEDIKYLTCLKDSIRGEDTLVDYFAHPISNGLQLLHDIEIPNTLSRAFIQDPTPITLQYNDYIDVMRSFGKGKALGTLAKKQPTSVFETYPWIMPERNIKKLSVGAHLYTDMDSDELVIRTNEIHKHKKIKTGNIEVYDSLE